MRVGNNTSSQKTAYPFNYQILKDANDNSNRNHEVQILGRECDEAAESAAAWDGCLKNPKHKEFIPVQDAWVNPLIRSLSDEEHEYIRLTADLTVRLRVNHTSLGRPDKDELSDYRGSNNLRVGTGFIWHVDCEINKPCPCNICDGTVVRKHWIFKIHTAQHVIYNTEEAKKTKVDLFYDDERSQKDGKVVSLWGTRAVRSRAESDYCLMECVSHDKRIGERVKSIYCRWISLYYANGLLSINPKKFGLSNRLREIFARGDQDYALIISHPHGQSKMMTVGKLKDGVKYDDDCIDYHTATCPGCSGAKIVGLYRDGHDARLRHRMWWRWSNSVHSGSHGKPSSFFKEQVNYGNTWYPSIH